MTTARDLIQDALELLGIYSPGETMTAADTSRCLSTLNQMMDQWSNLPLNCYEVLEQTAPLVPGVSSYTIGAGGAFNMTRPLKILDGPGRAYLQDASGTNYAMQVVSRDLWNSIDNRSSLVTSDIPSILFYDPQFPLGIINITPTPTQAISMFWDSMLQLTQFTGLTTTLMLPPGYERAIVTNLAVMVSPYFSGSIVSPQVAIEASQTLATIKRTNMRPINARYDPAITRIGGRYTLADFIGGR